MNIVSFFAPRPAHPHFQDYTPFLDVLRDSCKKYGHRHIVLTDDPAVGRDGDAFVVDLPDSLMLAATAAQLAYLESDFAAEDSVLLGADCVLANDPEVAFARAFDVAFTTHPFSDCILNTGAIFVRGGAAAAAIWRQALEECGDEWGDDQKSLAKVVGATLEHGLHDRCALKIRFLPVDPFNLAPDHPGHDCSHAVIVHFRGDRKAWMVDYCAKTLGLGPGVQTVALCNTPDKRLFANVAHNSRRSGVSWIADAAPEHDGHAVIVGGGPSIADTLREIRRRATDGQTIFALNGAGRWLSARGLRPDHLVIIDARESNAEFLAGDPADHYLLASQCAPALIDLVPPARATLFHSATEGIDQSIPPGVPDLLVGGGIVSGLTAMALVFTMGYRKIHLYGYDSSDKDGAAHAYAQSETDQEKRRFEAWCNDRKFVTSFAMYKQAEAFPAFSQMLADAGALITVHGDGLLPALARTMMTATPITMEA